MPDDIARKPSHKRDAAKKKAADHAYYVANKERIKERVREYTKENRERIQKRKHQYAKAHAQEKQVYDTVYRAINKDTMRAYAHTYHSSHKSKINARTAAWREKNRERHNANSRAYYRAHPAKAKEVGASRRARKAGAPINDLTEAQWHEIQHHYGHKCVYCKRRRKILTKDHITPLSKGGSHTASNIVPACLTCNLRKHNGPPLTPVQPLLLTVAPVKPRKS